MGLWSGRSVRRLALRELEEYLIGLHTRILVEEHVRWRLGIGMTTRYLTFFKPVKPRSASGKCAF
jgi:hypothetical protein